MVRLGALVAFVWFFLGDSGLGDAERVTNIVGDLGPTGLLGLAVYFLARWLRREQARNEKGGDLWQANQDLQAKLDASEAARLTEAQSAAKVMLSFIREANQSNQTPATGRRPPA